MPRDKAKKAAYTKRWYAANKARLKVYYRTRHIKVYKDPVTRAKRQKQARDRYQANLEAGRAHCAAYWKKNARAIKLKRALGITIHEARLILAKELEKTNGKTQKETALHA